MSATTPLRILFATDLSGRCDRALDRALLLAQQWQARLEALTVVEPGDAGSSERSLLATSSAPWPSLTPRQRAERRLRADLATSELPLVARAEQGPVVDTILAVAEAEGSDLIVTGVARNEALSRIVLGSTVDALARRSPVPLLVVRNRARAPYGSVLAATDFSAASRHALVRAAALFPRAALALYHAFDNPYPVVAGVDPAKAVADGREHAEREARAFLDGAALPEAERARIRCLLDHGHPGLLLRERGATRPDELLVLGTHRRKGLLGFLLGSEAERILEMAEHDVLLVPPAASQAGAPPPRRP